EAGRQQGLARHAPGGILPEDRVEYGIRDLVCNLVGMTLGYRLRGEQILLSRHRLPPVRLVTSPYRGDVRIRTYSREVSMGSGSAQAKWPRRATSLWPTAGAPREH